MEEKKIPSGSGTISGKGEAKADGKFFPSGSGSIIGTVVCK
jgi:hypothetical protein